MNSEIIDNVEESVEETKESEIIDNVESAEESVVKDLKYVKELDPDIYKDGKVGFPEETRPNNTTNTLGLDDEIPEEDLKEIKKIALKNLIENDYKNIDKNLDEDTVKIPGQNYCVISFVGPEFTAKTETNGLRLMGSFETAEEAQDYIDSFEEKTYDTCVVEMYKFVPSRPSLKPETQKQVDKFLNDIIIKHKTEREESRLSFEFRKNRLMKNDGRFIEKNPAPVQESAPILDEDLKETIEESNEMIARDKTHEALIKKLKQRRLEKETNIVGNTVRHLPRKRLTPSKLKIDGQNFAAVCFVGHSGKNQRIAMKIRGFFETYEECDDHCKELRDLNDSYDIIVTQMYNWVPCDPDVNGIKQKHTDEKLNELIEGTEKQSSTAEQMRNNIDVFKDISKNYQNEAADLDAVENGPKIDTTLLDNDVQRVDLDGTVR